MKRVVFVVSALLVSALACSAPAESGSAVTATAPAAAVALSQPTGSEAPTSGARHVILQNKDLSLAVFGLDGQSTLFGKAPLRLSGGQYEEYGVAGSKLYAMSSYNTPSNPPQVYAIDASGAQVLPLNPKMPQGFAAWIGSGQQTARVAWGEVDYEQPTAPPPGSDATAVGFPPADGRIMIADVTATGAKPAYQIVSNEGRYPSPLHWTPDGQHLFYSMEPSGIGGYIPFGGRSSLYDLDVSTGQSTEVIPFDNSTFLCLEELSPDLSMISSHCEKQVSIISLASKAKTVIALPDGVPASEVGFEGSVHFSPDGKRVAFAMLGTDPQNQQGWVAVTDDLSGTSRLIATSQPKNWYSVIGWLDDSHLLAETNNTNGDGWETIQVLSLDGTAPRDLATESDFVAFVP